MNLPGVLQMTDTLEAGGAERVAVNLANLLPRARYRSFFCTTRRAGSLAELLQNDVGRICLARTHTFERRALMRLVNFIRAQQIRLLHAHGTALLAAVLASLCPPYPRVVWHDHYGKYATEERPRLLYYLLSRRVSRIIAVNQPLADWARTRLRVPAERVCYLPNFVVPAAAEENEQLLPELPGVKDNRIVCVANLRPQKDHLTLLRALARVAAAEPAVHLLLAGAVSDEAYLRQLRQEIEKLGLARHVTVLGEQRCIPALLRHCAVGVLSSASEGLPLALLEYGNAGLAVVATDVGQCAEVLDGGRAGLLVPRAAPAALAEAVIGLLREPQKRLALGASLRRHIDETYSPQTALREIGRIYEAALQHK